MTSAQQTKSSDNPGNHTYTVSLYCSLDTRVECCYELNSIPIPDFLDERDDIDRIMAKIGKGVEWVGASGRRTVYEVQEKCMPKLAREISKYNRRDDLIHIILVEII